MSEIKLFNGDVFQGLRCIDDNTIDMAFSSPPYWKQRVYGVPNEIGLEPSIDDHIDVLISVFDEVKRVLKPGGALWVNYGDGYSTTKNGRPAEEIKEKSLDDRRFTNKPFSTVSDEIPATNLLLLNDRLRIAMQAAGWIVRSKCIWGKPNAMPDSSARFRPGVSFEEITLFRKPGKAFYDSEAVRVPPAKNISGDGRTISSNASRSSMASHTGLDGKWRHKSKKEQQKNGRLLRAFEEDITRLYQNDVLIQAARKSETNHSASFPLELVLPAIDACCPKGSVILDPFAGSGTVGVAAALRDHDAILIDADVNQLTLASERISSMMPLFPHQVNFV